MFMRYILLGAGLFFSNGSFAQVIKNPSPQQLAEVQHAIAVTENGSGRPDPADGLEQL